jgi:hypothetical protein
MCDEPKKAAGYEYAAENEGETGAKKIAHSYGDDPGKEADYQSENRKDERHLRSPLDGFDNAVERGGDLDQRAIDCGKPHFDAVQAGVDRAETLFEDIEAHALQALLVLNRLQSLSDKFERRLGHLRCPFE